MPITGADGVCVRPEAIHVAAAALVDSAGRVLISRRPEGVHQGGLWEFPGGKLKPLETSLKALARELDEELGIRLQRARPLIQVHHEYPDRRIWLDVWCVESWSGVPRAQEGQAIRWAQPKSLNRNLFPAADGPIITALMLPPLYLITPDPRSDRKPFLQRLTSCLQAGVRLIQLRAKRLDPMAYRRLARQALALCEDYGAALLLNADPEVALDLGAQGVHLTGRRLLRYASRPLDNAHWVAASCHDERELAHACRIGIDFVVLSPVRSTSSHPAGPSLGWERFRTLVCNATVPVYALGGMDTRDLRTAWAHGGQGVACISALWGQVSLPADIA